MEISLLETFRANCSRGSLQVVSPQGRSASQQVCDERLKDIDNTSQLGNMSSPKYCAASLAVRGLNYLLIQWQLTVHN